MVNSEDRRLRLDPNTGRFVSRDGESDDAYYSHDTPRDIVDKIKRNAKRGLSLKSPAVMDYDDLEEELYLQSMVFRAMLLPLGETDKWAEVCDILKKEHPEVHKVLSEKKLTRSKLTYDTTDDALGYLFFLLFILLVLSPFIIYFIFS